MVRYLQNPAHIATLFREAEYMGWMCFSQFEELTRKMVQPGI